jgi:hypothetical protein
VPQFNVPPQPSPAGPQVMAWLAQVRGLQTPLSMLPHWPSTPPPPQVWPAGQDPQLSVPPQPSPAGPQPMPSLAQVSGTQQAPPQTPSTPPPPQTSQPEQVPQFRLPPQPSPAGPQLKPCFAQVVGVQVPESMTPHWPSTPPPPQVCGAVQTPQLSVPPQPSPAGPQL